MGIGEEGYVIVDGVRGAGKRGVGGDEVGF